MKKAILIAVAVVLVAGVGFTLVKNRAGTSNESRIEAVVNPNKNPNITWEVTKTSGDFRIVTVRENTPTGGGGANLILKRSGETWEIVHAGQDAPGCGIVQIFQIPAEIHQNTSCK